jgi:hypothetical protein
MGDIRISLLTELRSVDAIGSINISPLCGLEFVTLI